MCVEGQGWGMKGTNPIRQAPGRVAMKLQVEKLAGRDYSPTFRPTLLGLGRLGERPAAVLAQPRQVVGGASRHVQHSDLGH